MRLSLVNKESLFHSHEAYGQTGSGKTYTISGDRRFAHRGIIPRALGKIFDEFTKVERNAANLREVINYSHVIFPTWKFTMK